MRHEATPAGAMLWRRIDAPGHDACRLEAGPSGWWLDGSASFRHEGSLGCLHYELHCDRAWRLLTGQVRGWLEARRVEMEIARTLCGSWTLNGVQVLGLDGLADLDLGFTPATNLTQLRRLHLEIGEAANAPVAWLDVTAGTLTALLQRYERRTEDRYWYEAPRFGYAAELEVDTSGFVRTYPELWQAEP